MGLRVSKRVCTPAALRDGQSAPVRKSVKVFGAINVTHAERPRWHYRFDKVFNTQTYLRFC